MAMASSSRLNDSANRRAQIIAAQALREIAAAPSNLRAKRKRRSYSSWNTPTATTEQAQAQPTESTAESSPGPAAKQ